MTTPSSANSRKALQPWVIDAAGVGAVIALSLGVYVVDVRPTQRARAEQSAQRAELAAQRRKADELSSSLHKIQDVLQQTRAKAEEGALQLEPIRKLNERLARLTELATNCRLSINAVEPAKPAPGPHCDVVEVRVSCQGTFRGCSEFLDRLHKEMPDTAVAAMEVSGKPGAKEVPVAMSFTIYWFAAKPDAGSK